MVIVFSHIDFFTGEADILKALFEKGLERLHLKKLGDISKWRALLQKLPASVLDKIVIHSNYELAQEFPGLKLHSGKAMENEDRFVSSSAHSMEELKLKLPQFDYVFLSPIYTSLSKDKYSPKEVFEVDNLKENERGKVVALGGIEYSRLVDLRLQQFQHIALLGTLWNQPELAISSFIKIKKEWESLEQIY